MNRNEIVDFFNENYGIRKKDLGSLEKIYDVANNLKYKIEKIDKDNFILEEFGIIKDFSKPVKIIREVTDRDGGCYNGVPLGEICNKSLNAMGDFNVYLYCKLINMNDGDIIDLNDGFSIRSYDLLQHYRYIYEKDDCIEIYVSAFSNKNPEKEKMPYKYFNGQVKRLALVK